MVVEIVASIVLGWFIVNFPLFSALASDIKVMLKLNESELGKSKSKREEILTNKYISYIINLIFESLWNCYKCSTFWFSLIVFNNLLVAGIASLLIYILEKNNII